MTVDKKINFASGLVFGYGLFSSILGVFISFVVAVYVDTNGDLIGEVNTKPMINGLFILFFTAILSFFLYKKKKFAYWLTLIGSLLTLLFNLLMFTVADTLIINYLGMFKISGSVPIDLIVILIQLIVPIITSIFLLKILFSSSVRTSFK
jgi:hypothetical protein